MEDVMLTTFDNPFNPFDDFDKWWKEDLRLGYDCCGLLALNAATSPIYGDEVNDQIIREAMVDICSDFPLIFRIVTQNSFKKDTENRGI